MFSYSSKYAVKALLYIALHSSETNKIMAKNLSKPINVPQAYIAKLLQKLSKENLVSSSKGPKGGFYLNEENLSKTIMDVVNVIEEKRDKNSCMLSLEGCNEDKPCPLHYILSPSRNQILSSLKNKTIGDLKDEIKLGISFLPL